MQEEDILNYSPTVMFRGTPCILFSMAALQYRGVPTKLVFVNISHGLITIQIEH